MKTINLPCIWKKGLEPCYSSEHASGADLKADLEEPLEIKPGGRVLVPTGLFLALPEGFEAQVRPRSGLALKHGLTVLNSPGTIDADYRGEIKVILINLGQENYLIKQGERIAQLVIAPVIQAKWQACEKLEESKRGPGGFGSTGR